MQTEKQQVAGRRQRSKSMFEERSAASVQAEPTLQDFVGELKERYKAPNKGLAITGLPGIVLVLILVFKVNE